MLSAARNAKNKILSEKFYNYIERKFPNDESCLVSAGILLANTYALIGDKFMASNIRMKLNQQNVRKKIGHTWTVVDGKIYVRMYYINLMNYFIDFFIKQKFCAHDRSHPRSKEIYDQLDRIRDQLLEHNHKYDGSWITRPLADDETIQSILCGHSERIAIAFNLIQQPIPSWIQIVKNLRICGDCR